MHFVREPLVFKPAYKEYIWGGSRISEKYGRLGTPDICAESWEIAARPDGDSVVSHGRFAGQSLSELTAEFGTCLTGTRAPEPSRFPLLFKLIDARECLSVQVHPNESNACLTGGEPKTELWVVLDCTPDSCLYAGLREGSSPAMLQAALSAGSAEQHLLRLKVKPGQALFIPGGLVHAIGAGCLIYEIQQNSNTTYRLFDWNRIGPDNKSRALHIEDSLKSIDWSLPAPQLVSPAAKADNHNNQSIHVSRCAFFTTRQLDVVAPENLTLDGTSFHAIFNAEGVVEITAGGKTVRLDTGTSALIPADAKGYRLTPAGHAKLFVTSL
ncbi:MAG: class I mannose-6-phosphate isomerase [Kiritimatiellae bacterium]|nr:class I mannose-6-phosphate isomerase [Kiritimatiellia bacterium]